MALCTSVRSGRNERQPRICGEWSGTDVSLYLGRCQVDTPDELVADTWAKVAGRRPSVGTVVDFGAGDGRFARHGTFGSYVGYEIDASRFEGVELPARASLVHRCAFSNPPADVDLCIGNPPFVRNQDLPEGWRSLVSQRLHAMTGIRLSGLANAWQYFLLLSLVAASDDGLCALVIPYEWVSRPSARTIRDYIRANSWEVEVFRMEDAVFSSVLTTASITVIDKAARTGRWSYNAVHDGESVAIPSTSGSRHGHLTYATKRRDAGTPWAMRGLSPGTQRALVLTEWERARCGLVVGRDVVACLTSLRDLPPDVDVLDEAAFAAFLKAKGRRCWLVRSDREPSPTLRAYLDQVPDEWRKTATCSERDEWWRFKMPRPPAALVATCFKGKTPKACVNEVGAVAVGGVAGIHGAEASWVKTFLQRLSALDLTEMIVSHANGLHKIEIGQLNTLLAHHEATVAG